MPVWVDVPSSKSGGGMAVDLPWTVVRTGAAVDPEVGIAVELTRSTYVGD